MALGSAGTLRPSTSRGAALGGGGGCPEGSVEVSVIPQGPGKAPACPPGATKVGSLKCCQPQAAAASPGMPQVPLPGGGAGAPTATPPPRPDLNPINPQAEYDPEIARALAERRGYTKNLETGAGHSMDVLQTSLNDQIETEVTQARAAADAAGIPFDEGAYRANAQRNKYGALAQEKLGREKMIGESLGAGEQVATAEGGERNQRLGISLQSQQASMQDLLQRYGLDVQRYGIDVNAANAANNALLNFYSQLMGGMFGMMGNVGNQSFTNYSSYS